MNGSIPGSISGPAVGLINRAEGSRLKYADAAGQVGGEKRLLEQASKATHALMSVQFESADGAVSHEVSVRPQLAPPKRPVTEKKLDAAARFVELMAKLVGVLGDASLQSLETRIASLKVVAESAGNSSHALLAQYESALADLQAALENADTTEGELQAAKNRLSQAEQTLASAQACLDGLSPGEAGYDEALAARDAARSGVDAARQGVSTATSAHEGALSKAQAANAKADQLLKALDAGQGRGSEVLESQRRQNLDAASRMVLFMARFAELIGDAAEVRLEAEKKTASEIRDAQAAVALRKAEEYEDQVRKAEETNKKMGCIGKILGAVLTVVSVVGAVFTGGASLAIAAVGIALMAGDMIGKAITGVSFMEKAMKPVMDHVLSPIIAAIGKALTAALGSIGVDAEKAAMIGNIAGAIAGALLMVAAIVVVSVVGKGAASRIAPKLGEMIGKIAGKMVPDLLKQGSKSASRMFSQMATKIRGSVGLQSDAASLAKYGTRLEMAMAGTEGVSATAQSALQIKSATHQAKAAEHMASVVVATSIVESMAVWLQDQVQMFGDSINQQFKVIEQMAAEMQNSTNTSLYIARHI